MGKNQVLEKNVNKNVKILRNFNYLISYLYIGKVRLCNGSCLNKIILDGIVRMFKLHLTMVENSTK